MLAFTMENGIKLVLVQKEENQNTLEWYVVAACG